LRIAHIVEARGWYFFLEPCAKAFHQTHTNILTPLNLCLPHDYGIAQMLAPNWDLRFWILDWETCLVDNWVTLD
jgi:hypothetical protein